VKTPELFFEKAGELREADIVLFGAPLDRTASHRGGSRFAPAAIRGASHYMESYSVRTGFDWDDLKLADVGDINAGDVDPAVEEIQAVVREIAAMHKLPAMFGGEHTQPYALRALTPKPSSPRRHPDLRDELFERLCHATYLRRAHEE
jgi:agmatinase